MHIDGLTIKILNLCVCKSVGEHMKYKNVLVIYSTHNKSDI